MIFLGAVNSQYNEWFLLGPSCRHLSRIPLLSIACLPNHEGNSPSRYREFSRPTKTLFPSISGIELGQEKRKHMRVFYAPIFLCRQASNCDAKISDFSSGENKRSDAFTWIPQESLCQASFLLACLLACYIGASIFRQNSIFTEKSCCFPANHRSREISFSVDINVKHYLTNPFNTLIRYVTDEIEWHVHVTV